MNTNRSVSILLGVAAALLVIMTGKACSDSLDPQKTPVKNTATSGVSSLLPPDPGFQQAPPPEGYGVEETAPPVIEYQDVTDESGEVIGTIAVEPETEYITKSMAEQYEEKREENRNNKISGYYHDSTNVPKSTSATVEATFPDDFVLYIG